MSLPPAPADTAQVASAAPPLTPAAKPPAGGREALIYVPGLGQDPGVQQTVVAELLAWELSQRAADRAARFAVTPTSVDADIVHRIRRTGTGDPEEVVDVYCFDTAAVASRFTSPTAPVLRVVSLGLTVVAAVVALTVAMVNPHRTAKRSVEVLQALALVFFVLCIVAYFGVAVVALVQAVLMIVSGPSTEPIIEWPQWVVLVGAVVGGLLPSVRETINTLGERTVQMARYVWTGTLRNRLSGGLQDLVDRVLERPEIDRVHLLGYSFGSLIALETVFPHNPAPASTLRRVSSVITVGCPFDLVRMVSPTFGTDRVLDAEIDPAWLNVYQPIDVLGSSFSDPTAPIRSGHAGTAERRPAQNVAWNADLEISFVNVVMLRSLSVHGGYWDDATKARSALGPVVDFLYAGKPALR